MAQCIIYLLKNTVNEKVYVGQTWRSLEERWASGCGYKKSLHINNAIEKYGKDNFYYEILALVSNQSVADYLETLYIKEHNSLDRAYGYNLRDGGSNGRMSIETRKHLSLIRKGTRLGEENTMYGKHHTLQTRELMSKNSDHSGEKNSRAILTKEKVETIIADPRSERTIAKEYGVSRSTINSIKRGINWRK